MLVWKHLNSLEFPNSFRKDCLCISVLWKKIPKIHHCVHAGSYYLDTPRSRKFILRTTVIRRKSPALVCSAIPAYLRKAKRKVRRQQSIDRPLICDGNHIHQMRHLNV